MPKSYDAIIIGAGVIGAAIALELSKAGYRTLSLDKNPAAGYGSTSSSCAIIRVHYSTLEGTAFAYEAYHHWRDWPAYIGNADERGPVEYRETGCLVMRTEHNGFLERNIAICSELGIPHEVWDGARIRQRLPIYDLTSYWPPKRINDEGFGEPGSGEVESGLYFPTAGYVVDPQLATHNFQRAAEANGATFLFGRTVAEILQENGRVSGVRLDNGEDIAAPIVVNAAGPHSFRINTMAGVLDDMTIATRPLRQEVVHLPGPADFDFYENAPVISDADIACYCRPDNGNHILVGTEEPDCDPLEWVDDPDALTRDFTEQWTHQAWRYGQRVPSLGIPGQAQGVVDLYDVSTDWIPVYDKSSLPGFYMAVGTSGNQFKNAPVAGRMMAELIAYCEAGNDHDAEPMRFELPIIGRTIDAGFYSRRRPVNADSSFSVLG